MNNYKIYKLQTTNFRNLNPDIITFNNNINCIFGENGNGKTNILEAINVLCTKKSFRKNASFPQYLSIDGAKPEIIFSAVINNSDGQKFSYSIKMDNENQYYFLDGAPVKKRLDIKVVFINPFDSYPFHNISSDRRAWFDYFIGQLDDNYKKKLGKYNLALRFRNTLLSKKPLKFKEQILANDEQFSLLSEYITNRRLKFIEEIKPFIKKTFQQIFLEDHDLQINLDSRFINLDAKTIQNNLFKNIESDSIKSFTHHGIHRDDYVLLLNGLNSFDFSSLGQQKISYLSLLFAYIELFRYKYYFYPIVLIDDVSGELDRVRWSKLVEYLKKQDFQVLITTANENFKEELDRIEGANKIQIKQGSLVH